VDATITISDQMLAMDEAETTLDRLAAKVSHLYSLPAVAVQVLELTGDPGVDTHALKACIENDPALTTKVLRVVNSSLFGLSRHVSDLNQALALLGIKPLKLLVLGFSLPSRLFQGIAGEVLSQYWRHALTKAVAAREIAEKLWHLPGDEAFVAGLLQDLGVLVLIQELGDPYVEFLRRVQGRGGDLLDWESRLLGFDHTTLSACVLRRWRLPDALADAVQTGNRLGAGRFDTGLGQVLQLAEMLARLLADGQADALGELLAAGKRDGSLTPGRVEDLVGGLEEKVRQLADIFSLQLPAGQDYVDVLTRAHQRLAEVASEAAAEMLSQQPHRHAAAATDDEALLEQLASLRAVVAAFTRGATEPTEPGGSGRTAHVPAASSAAGERSAPSAKDAVRRANGPEVADPGLMGRLAAAAAACRQLRCALSLLLVDPIDAGELARCFGVEGYDGSRRFLEAACRLLGNGAAICLAHGEAGFAVVLPNCERQAAVRLGNELIDKVKRLPLRQAVGTRRSVGLAVGAATVNLPPKNFLPEDLFTAAARCLYGSRLSGGGVVKSIEI
jgi:HD-like signal output (HDOD) protein